MEAYLFRAAIPESDWQKRRLKDPFHMIPNDKPKHLGYCLSCYHESGPLYSIPMDVTTEVLRLTLGREYPINAEPLTLKEFQKVFQFVVGAIELGWHDSLEFYIEGMNLPADWQ